MDEACVPRGGYRRASQETWDQARLDYQGGDTAWEVCARHGLKVGTLRARAAAEGWRRVDAPEVRAPEPVDLDSEEAAALPDYADMARVALIRLNRALETGRAAEAASWMRLHQRLLALASSEREPPPPAPEVVDERDLEARQAYVEARLAAIAANSAARPNSDNSDDSDPVFSAPESEIRGPAPPVDPPSAAARPLCGQGIAGPAPGAAGRAPPPPLSAGSPDWPSRGPRIRHL